MKTHNPNDIVTTYKFSIDDGRTKPKRLLTIDKAEASHILLEVLDSPLEQFNYIGIVKQKMYFSEVLKELQKMSQ